MIPWDSSHKLVGQNLSWSQSIHMCQMVEVSYIYIYLNLHIHYVFIMRMRSVDICIYSCMYIWSAFTPHLFKLQINSWMILVSNSSNIMWYVPPFRVVNRRHQYQHESNITALRKESAWKSSLTTCFIPHWIVFFVMKFEIPFPKLTASLPLKTDAWKIFFLLGYHLFKCYVSFKEGNSKSIKRRAVHALLPSRQWRRKSWRDWQNNTDCFWAETCESEIEIQQR